MTAAVPGVEELSMKRLTLVASLAIVLSSACADPSSSFVVRGVRLFDGDVVLENMSVLVEDGHIAAVAAHLDPPGGVTVVDGRGRTLLPGLIDSHAHALGDALADALRFGVTTELDMFTDHSWAAERRAEQRAGAVTDRADLFSAGTLVTAPGGHGTEYPLQIPTLEDAADADAFVSARLAEGSDYIKVILDDGAGYGLQLPTLDDTTLRAVVDAAHRRKVLAVVHVTTQNAALAAITAGADGLMHIFADTRIEEKLVQAALGHRVFVVPTLVVVESLGSGARGAATRDDAALSPFLSPEQHRTLAMSFPFADGQRTQLTLAQEAVRHLHHAGVPMLAGTDAPNPGTAHGVSLHRELELLVAAGLTPVEALRAATSVPASAFRLGDRGRIAADLKADLVLVAGDPTTSITATRNIVTIWKDGVAVNRQAKPAAAPLAAPVTLLPGTVSDFEDGTLTTRIGFGWAQSTDTMMGGASSADLEVVRDGENRYLRVHGTIATGATFPWAGAMLFLGTQPMAPANGSGLSGMYFRARGRGVLRIMVFADSLGWIPAEHQVRLEPSWRRFAVPFELFAGVDTRAVKAILFSGGPEQGEFDFAIDEVGFDAR